MTIIINLALIFGLLFYGRRLFNQGPLSRFYWPAVLLKIVMGLLVGWLYRYYYHGGDTFAFFDAAIALKNSAFNSFPNFVDIYFRNEYGTIPGFGYTWIPSAFFVKLLAIFALITGDNYWVTSLYFSIVSFLGMWRWTSLLTRLLPNYHLAMISGFFFPSLLFWSSGILKEALVIPLMALLLSLLLQYYLGDKINPRKYLWAILLFSILVILKYFIAAILLVMVLTIMVARRILPTKGKWYYEIVTLGLILVVAGGLISLLHPNLWPSRMAAVIYQNYTAYLDTSGPGSAIVFSNFSGQATGLLVSLPKAIVAGLVLPLTPINGAPISWFSVIENWFLILLLFNGLIHFSIPKSRDYRLLLWGGGLFVLISAGLITLSTPNFGTLARYKTTYLLVLLPLLMPAINTLYQKLVSQG